MKTINDEKQHYQNMLEDCLILWRKSEVARALELGVIDEQTARDLEPVDDDELFRLYKERYEL